MITEKDIKARLAQILTDSGFNVLAQEIYEGFAKPAVFVSVTPSSAKLLSCGGATEVVSDSVEIKYISAAETVEDCINAADRIKRLFLHRPFDIGGRHITVDELEFEIEKNVLYVNFDINFVQAVDYGEKYEEMQELVLSGKGGIE